MSFFSQLMLRLRFHRRRHRHLAITAAAVVSVVMLSAFFLLQSDSAISLLSLATPDGNLSWLPSVLRKLPTWLHVDSTDQLAHPFDPLKALKTKTPPAESTPLPPISATNQAKLEFIKSAYKGDKGKKLAMAHEYNEKIWKVILEAKPKCGKLNKYPNGFCHAERVETRAKSQLIFTEEHLSLFLQLSTEERNLMAESHKYALENLPDTAPKGLYQGNGIVYVGGGKFNWLALLSIRSLRAQNCQLPVEVLVPTLDEYELELCSRIFPVMNAKCIHLPTALFSEKLVYSHTFKFSGYQYKSLAILLSSFENVLLLDSDNVPAYSPDHFFTQEPFPSKGLIVWPDFWHRTTSPHYYEIAGVEVSKDQLLPRYHEMLGEYVEQTADKNTDWLKVNFHERVGAIPDPSSESGQLMISKKTHLNSLLLALYYNLYGPGYYYPLFSQGAPGEGDKETFLAATIATHKPYYQVAKFLDALGNVRDNNFNGNAMGQYDAVQDYNWTREKSKLRKSLSGDELEAALNKLQSPKIIFVHANTPKLDPWKCYLDHDTVDEQGQRYRLYGLGMKVRTGTDFEQDQWNYMHQLLCDLELKINVFSKVDRKELCKEIKAHRDWLASTENTLE